DVDHALHLERDERLAHRRPADGQLGGQLALRRRPVADLQPLGVDVVEQPLDELLVEAGAGERTQRLTSPGGCGHRTKSTGGLLAESFALSGVLSLVPCSHLRLSTAMPAAMVQTIESTRPT